ncbi:MAG: hypothetical protein Alpg2KO_08510 [Alphaproteobacteria bacterium]
MSQFFYLLMLALFIVHEMDAMQRREWRVLPLLSRLPDAAGQTVFLLGHVPLLLALFWFDGLDHQGMIAQVLSAFAIVHVGLHWLFRRHPAYDYNNTVSIAVIVGTGIAGAIHLALLALPVQP